MPSDVDGDARLLTSSPSKGMETLHAEPSAPTLYAKNRMKIFAPITKVDSVQRMVYGVAAAEEPDKSGEILDFESSVPHFKSWSEQISKVTDGKSVGNVRAMHGKVSAGVLKSIDFDHATKQIPVSAFINDDAEWKKVQDGNYTGFSIGGDYVRKWKDGELNRYEARPTEISIVDNPCIPSATFQMVKADGQTEQVPFVGRVTKQVWTCGTPAHEHEMKADALKCDGAEAGPGLTVTVDATEAMKLVKDALAKAASPDAVKKCLYQIAQLAGALQSVGWVHSAEEYEAAAETDGSTVPDKIKAGITALFEALSAMVDEEAAEWTSEEGLAMAVASTLEKINAKPERVRELLSKRAETEEQMEAKELQKVIGASEDKLAKLIGEGFAAIGTRVEGVEATIKTVTDRLEKVEQATPAPGGPKLRAVDKSADNPNGNEKAEQVPADTHGLVKSALGKPILTVAGAGRVRG